jgi:hypothetical protein
LRKTGVDIFELLIKEFTSYFGICITYLHAVFDFEAVPPEGHTFAIEFNGQQ